MICFQDSLIKIDIPQAYIIQIMTEIQQQKQEEKEQQAKFEDKDTRVIFNFLMNKVSFMSRPYDEFDLKADIVLRYEVPTDNDAYILKVNRAKAVQLFNNLPVHYREAYKTASEYIDYHVQKNQQKYEQSHLYTRNITCFQPILQTKSQIATTEAKEDIQSQRITSNLESERRMHDPTINDGFYLKKQIIDNAEEKILQIKCDYKYSAVFDHFTLNYNMIMIILQQLCGLQVKSYLLEDEKTKTKAVYFLISSSLQKQKSLANLYHLKKQIYLQDIDFNINQPMDNNLRPLRLHSKFKQQQYNWLLSNTKLISRALGCIQNAKVQQINKQLQLQQQQINRYIQYQYQLTNEIVAIMKKQSQVGLTDQQQIYLFLINDGKKNQGSQKLFQQLNLKRTLFHKIIQLNRKYKYKSYQFLPYFQPLQLSAKNRPFFQKLSTVLKYKYQKVSPYGQLALFNKMERNKLVSSLVSGYFKFENYERMNIKLQLYALNDDFEKYGNHTSQFVIQDSQVQIQSVFGGLDGKVLFKEWSMIPFMSNLRCLRDYFGQFVAFTISAKIYIFTLFICLIPFALFSQFYLQTVWLNIQENPRNTFIFHFIQLGTLILSLTIFIVFWQKHQNKFISLYENYNQLTSYSVIYQGPYYRNLQTDNLNAYKTQSGIIYFIYQKRWLLLILILLGLEFLFFYFIRQLLVRNAKKIPQLNFDYVSLPHLIFYGIYFIVNFLFIKFIFVKIVKFIIRQENYATKAEQQQNTMSYLYIFEFGYELVGPIFLTIIEPFQKLSCYNSQCTTQIQRYIFTRFAIIIIFIFVNLRQIISIFIIRKLCTKNLSIEDKKPQQLLNFSIRMLAYIQHVQRQYSKQDIEPDYLLQQAVLLFFFCLFMIIFPFSAVISVIIFYIRYVLYRYSILQSKRRPLAISRKLVRYSKVFLLIRRISTVINIWIIVFSNEIIQYELKQLLIFFVTEFTVDSILIFKIIVIVLIFIIVESIMIFFGFIVRIIIQSDNQKRNLVLQTKRKRQMHIRHHQTIKHKKNKKPLTSIFRAYSNDALLKKSNANKELFQDNKQPQIKAKARKQRLNSQQGLTLGKYSQKMDAQTKSKRQKKSYEFSEKSKKSAKSDPKSKKSNKIDTKPK